MPLRGATISGFQYSETGGGKEPAFALGEGIADLYIILVNSTIWSNPDYPNTAYKALIDGGVNLCRSYGLNYVFKLQRTGYKGDKWTAAGTNWKIVDNASMRDNALKMYRQLTRRYASDPKCQGIYLMNEAMRNPEDPEYGSVANAHAIEERVLNFYREARQEIRSVSAGMRIWISPPLKWSHDLSDIAGLVDDMISDPNLGVSFHDYFRENRKRWYWAYSDYVSDRYQVMVDWYRNEARYFTDRGVQVLVAEFGVEPSRAGEMAYEIGFDWMKCFDELGFSFAMWWLKPEPEGSDNAMLVGDWGTLSRIGGLWRDYLQGHELLVNFNYRSTPISVDARINGSTLNSGETIVLNKGSTVNLSVPERVFR